MDLTEIAKCLGGSDRAAAERLGVKRTTFAMWRKRGRVPAHHVGRVAAELRVEPATVRPDLFPGWPLPPAQGRAA